METYWNNGGKKWMYEYKFRKGGKTLCAFYFKEKSMGFMVILGKQERLKVEENKEEYSQDLMELYDKTHTYHDGKWLMMELEDLSILEDIKKLIYVKRKANKKQ